MKKQELINKMDEFILKHSDDVDTLFTIYDSKEELVEDMKEYEDEEAYFNNDGYKENMFYDWFVDYYHDTIFHLKLDDEEVWLYLVDVMEGQLALQFLEENNLERVEE